MLYEWNRIIMAQSRKERNRRNEQQSLSDRHWYLSSVIGMGGDWLKVSNGIKPFFNTQESVKTENKNVTGRGQEMTKPYVLQTQEVAEDKRLSWERRSLRNVVLDKRKKCVLMLALFLLSLETLYVFMVYFAMFRATALLVFIILDTWLT